MRRRRDTGMRVRGLTRGGPGELDLVVVTVEPATANGRLEISYGDRAADHRIVSLTLPAGTPVVRDGRPARLGSLHAGDRLRIVGPPDARHVTATRP